MSQGTNDERPVAPPSRPDLADRCRRTAAAALAQANAKLPEASARDAAVVAGIMIQRADELDCVPARLDLTLHRHTEPHPVLSQFTPDQLRAILDAMRRTAEPAVDARPIHTDEPLSLPPAASGEC